MWKLIHRSALKNFCVASKREGLRSYCWNPLVRTLIRHRSTARGTVVALHKHNPAVGSGRGLGIESWTSISFCPSFSRESTASIAWAGHKPAAESREGHDCARSKGGK